MVIYHEIINEPSYVRYCNGCNFITLQSKKGGKDQESIQSSTIPHGKMTKTQLNITNKSQEVSPFPAGDQKAAMKRRESMTDNQKTNTNDQQKKYRLGTVSKNILLEGLNRFHGANLILCSDVDQGT